LKTNYNNQQAQAHRSHRLPLHESCFHVKTQIPVYQYGEPLAAPDSITSYTISEHKWASNHLPEIQMLAKANQVNHG
jgi:hypothetical protein